jgi:hypothetical protein
MCRQRAGPPRWTGAAVPIRPAMITFAQIPRIGHRLRLTRSVPGTPHNTSNGARHQYGPRIGAWHGCRFVWVSRFAAVEIVAGVAGAKRPGIATFASSLIHPLGGRGLHYPGPTNRQIRRTRRCQWCQAPVVLARRGTGCGLPDRYPAPVVVTPRERRAMLRSRYTGGNVAGPGKRYTGLSPRARGSREQRSRAAGRGGIARRMAVGIGSAAAHPAQTRKEWIT